MQGLRKLFEAPPEVVEAKNKRKQAVERALCQLGEMPQFVARREGLINVMNGCAVSATSCSEALVLTWHPGGAPTEAQRFHLTTPEQVTKFTCAMQMQAASLNAFRPVE